MRSGCTTSPSTRPAARRSMKSASAVASGAIMRSTDECEMSRSCHSATFSSAGAGVAAQQAREAGQVLRQDRVLLVRHRRGALLALAERLLGLADLGALPVAHLERDAARRRRRAAPARRTARRGDRAAPPAWPPSRGAGRARPSACCLDRRARRWRRCRPRRRSCRRAMVSRARDEAAAVAARLGVEAGEHQAERDRLGVDAVRAADHRRVRGARRRAACSAAQQQIERRRGSRRARRARAAAPATVSSTSDEVMPRCSQRASSPASSSTWVRKAITSWRVRSSISRMRAGSSLPARALAHARGGARRGPCPRAPSPRRRRARPRARCRTGADRSTARAALCVNIDRSCGRLARLWQ